MEDIKVSIICNAYNHEKYISDAIEGFIMQKTNFNYEVLIHDDASTDRTADIIREYELKYPNIIKPIYETENQYSKGDDSLYNIQNTRVRGKYIAICEGDDYWIDPYKLQKQYDLMELNPSINMCAHNAHIVKANTKKIIGDFACGKCSEIVPVADVIEGGGGFFPTNSLFYKASIEKKEPDFLRNFRLDFSLQIYGSLDNGILLIPQIMSVYRYMSDSSWSKSMRRDPLSDVWMHKKIIEMLKGVNEYTKGEYDIAVKNRILEEEYSILHAECRFKEMMDKKFSAINSNLTLKNKLKFYLCFLFPTLAKKYKSFIRGIAE